MPSSLHALLVEDNPADARLLREVVAEYGQHRLKLSHEDRLAKALARMDREHFDVVLLDLSLPDAEGLETLKRAHKHAPETPIVVLTGHDDEALALTAVRQGAQDYLVKGFVDANLLIRTINYATERKRSIEDLRRREEYFRSLIENALDIITVMNPDGTLRYGSPSFERVLGHRVEDFQTRSLLECVRPDDQEAVLQMVNASIAKPGETQTTSFWIRHKNGEWRVLEAISRSLIDQAEVNGIVVNSRDITERTLTAHQLAKANEMLRAVILSSPLAICTLDEANRVKSWNPAATRIFGWEEEELLNEPLPTITEEDQAAFSDRLGRARLGEPLEGFEVLNLRKDGSHVEVSIWTAALSALGGEGGLVMAVADNSERKRLEEQFRQSQKMEAVGRLAGGVAHDFNNLLTVITGYCEMVISQLSTTDPLRDEMDQVLKAADRATSLTKQLLAFSRRQVVQPKVIDLTGLLKDMEKMLRRLIGEHIHLIMKLQDGLGHIRADAGQIEQVIVNLVVNARDAMANGGKLLIETANFRFDEQYARQHLAANPGHYVMVAVSDNGVGIDPKILPNLFEPFFTTKEKGKGTGLGLSTSYGIVRQNGGNIYVYSEPGRGSTFRVYLPRVDEPLPEPSRHGVNLRYAGGQECLLVVEDEEGVRSVVQTMLNRLGYRVLVARDCDHAIELYDQHRIDLDMLLTDMVMPGMSGQELAAKLRTRDPALKVLYMSGYTDNALITHGALEPGMAFLQKPFAPEDLAVKVREVLDETR